MSQIYGQLFSDGHLSKSHIKMIELVGSDKQVLELGSSTGYLTKIMTNNNCTVDVVEIDKEDIMKAQDFARSVFLGSIEDEAITKKITESYDVVLAGDIIEHLARPDKFLQFIKTKIKPNGKLVLSTPNIACWEIRRDLFFYGQFNYQESGILDKTHLKFFTYHSIQALLNRSGFNIKKIFSMEISYPFRGLILRFGGLGARIDVLIGKLYLQLFPNLTTSHMVIEANSNG